MHEACQARGNGAVVSLLVEAGVDVNTLAPGLDFTTPLHIAACCGFAIGVRILLGVEGCRPNEQSATPARCTLVVH